MITSNYTKLGIITTVCFLVTYGVTFLNVDDFAHIYLSSARLYMCLLMITPVTLIILIVMNRLYTNKTANMIIGTGTVMVFMISLYFLRSQPLTDDVEYIKAMIPRHSSSILASKQARLDNLEVRQFAQKIIESRTQEIVEMQNILQRIENPVDSTAQTR